jgi:outer membrane lipoprotein-sorting protein
MNTAENIEKLVKAFFKIKKSSAATSSQMDKKILSDALAAYEKSKMDTSAGLQPSVWRIIMKSRITKLAVAAVIVIAAIIGIQFVGSPLKTNVTFADVIKPIMEARTVIFDFVAGGEEGKGPVIHDIVTNNKIRRTLSNMNMAMIIDLDKAKMLVLNDYDKTAAYVDITGPLLEQTKSFINFVRRTITDLKDWPVQELGQTNIDGLEAIGFKTKGQNEEVTIWADPQTAKPIRIELRLGQSFCVLKNIEFDVPVDESLVSMNVPPGYTQQKTEVDMGKFTEQDFIESLRIWAQYVLGGSFPEALSVEGYLKVTPLVGEKVSQSGISKEEGKKLGMTFGLGAIFFQQLALNGMDYHYAGKGVKLGDAEKAIFWYKPKGLQNYRVIYGDLSVKEVAPENLPK